MQRLPATLLACLALAASLALPAATLAAPPSPRLVLVALDTTPSEPAAGDTLGIWVTIENRGDAPMAGGSSARFEFDGEPIGAAPCNGPDGPGVVYRNADVPVGGSIRLYCEVVGVTEGSHIVRAVRGSWSSALVDTSRTITVGRASAPRALPFVETDDAPAWRPTFLWHRTIDRSAGGSAWYFGDEHGAGLDDNDYDVGMNGGSNTGPYFNRGFLVSPPIDLRGVEAATLSYWTRWSGFSSGSNGGNPLVEARAVGASEWSTVVERVVAEGEGRKTADLAAWAGTVAQVRFSWIAEREPGSGPEGWYLDDIAVTEGSPRPTACADSGPDAFGYRCVLGPVARDATDPSLVGFARGIAPYWPNAASLFCDVTNSGERDLGCPHGGTRPIALDFPFPFYGTSYAAVFVRDDGRLAFADPTSLDAPPTCSWGCPQIVAFGGHFPALANPGILHPYGMRVQGCEDRGLRCVLIEWIGVPFAEDVNGPASTYSVLLRQDGFILVTYADTSGDGVARFAGIRGSGEGNELTFHAGDLDFTSLAVGYYPPTLPPP